MMHGQQNIKSCGEDQNTHFMFNTFFLKKSYCLSDKVEKFLLLFRCINDCTNVPEFYIVRTLPILLSVVAQCNFYLQMSSATGFGTLLGFLGLFSL